VCYCVPGDTREPVLTVGLAEDFCDQFAWAFDHGILKTPEFADTGLWKLMRKESKSQRVMATMHVRD